MRSAARRTGGVVLCITVFGRRGRIRDRRLIVARGINFLFAGAGSPGALDELEGLVELAKPPKH